MQIFLFDSHSGLSSLELDPEGRGVLITSKEGRIITRTVAQDEHVASFDALMDLAKLAGYTIVSAEGNTL